MMVGRMLVSRLAPLLACLGLLGIWQVGALTLNTESFPTALEALRAVPAILGDKESLINILASLRRMEERQHGEDVVVGGESVNVLTHHTVPQ